jgi:hypothetical protein
MLFVCYRAKLMQGHKFLPRSPSMIWQVTLSTRALRSTPPSLQVQDVREAGQLMREAIKSSAMDPRTGNIDMGLLDGRCREEDEGGYEMRDC